MESVLNKIWPWFQTAADRIHAMKLPPDVEQLFDDLWVVMPSYMKKAIEKLIEDLAEKYDKDELADYLKKIFKALKEALS